MAHHYTHTLACDELWDVISDQQSVDLVRAFKGDKDQVAAELTNNALPNGTVDTRNCTAE